MNCMPFGGKPDSNGKATDPCADYCYFFGHP
jgi:hypothetical protein